MSSWSKHRKYTYASIVIVVAVVLIGVPSYEHFYKAPTCFDGLKNGYEQGIDCGGSCQKLCASAYLPPKVDWKFYEEIAPGIYNLAAYIENPNTDAVAVDVPFHMVLYSALNLPISDTKGTVTLPPHRNTLAFLSAVKIGGNPPNVAPFFEFTGSPDWNKKTDQLTSLVVGKTQFTSGSGNSSLQVTLTNVSVNDLPRLQVYAILYDQDKNPVGFSKTVVDGIPGNSSVTAPFTWPTDFGGKVISQEILPVAE